MSMPDMSKLPISEDPKTRNAQLAMVKVLSTPPEPLLNLFERLEIPWERVKIDGEACCVIKWSDLMDGESRNQAEGPYIKKVLAEMQANMPATPMAPVKHVEREVSIDKPAAPRQPKKRPPQQKAGG